MDDASESAAEPASLPAESTQLASELSRKAPLHRATSRDVLRFINQVELVEANSLVEKFGYTWRGAYCMLQRLRRDGLIERYLKAGEYIITQAGLRRIGDDKKQS